MRVEINFSGDSSEAVISSEEVTRAVRKLFVQAEETAQAVQEIKISSAQAAESSVAAKRMANDIQQIGQEARKSRREIEALRLSGAGTRNPGSGLGPFGSGFGRMGWLGAAVGLGTATSGPLGGGAAALGVGALGLTGGALGAVGVLVASFHGLGKAIDGDRQAFEKLSPATQTFVQDVRSLIPWLHSLQETARAGLLPGIDKGLHDFLNPQTAGAIQDTVRGISGELGKLAQEAGRGLGGPQFRQFLTDAGTHGVTQLDNLGSAVGHFADALLVLDHAGQPLTDWLTKVTDDGARFVDEYLKAADASGALGEKLGGAQHELELIGHLVGALGDAAIHLADDLTPLGNQIIVDLTHALQVLAHWLDQNHDKVVEITTGALTAFEDTIKILAPLVSDLAKSLDAVATAIGGWDQAFEIIIAGTLLNMMGKLALSITGVGAAAGTAAGETGVALLISRLKALVALSPILIPITLAVAAEKVGHGDPLGLGNIVGSLKGQGSIGQKLAVLLTGNKGVLGKALVNALGGPGPSGMKPTTQTQTQTNVNATGPGSGAASDVGGGFIPLGQSYVEKRSDQGRDLQTNPGGGIRAPGDGYCVRIGYDPKGFGPDYPIVHFTTGEYKGKTMYIGHCHSTIGPGVRFRAGDIIAKTGVSPVGNADVGGWAEIGFAPGGSPGPFGQPTPFGKDSAVAASPFGKPPAFNEKGANILPANLREAMAAASVAMNKAKTTPGKADDRSATKQDASAIHAAINWLNAQHFTGEDRITALLELASLWGQLGGLATKVAKKGPAPKASIISGQALATSTVALLKGDPGLTAADSAGPLQIYDAAEKHLKDVRAKLGPEIKKLAKEMSHPLSAADEAAMKAQMTQYRAALTTAVKAVADAAPALKAAFQSMWQGLADAATASLEEQRGNYKSPARILLDTLTAAHDTAALNDALDQANKDLATALKGHQADAQQQLDDIRRYVGTSFLVNAIDAAQSAILGGDTQQISGASILETLHGLLAGGNVVDPEEVKRAQKSVEEAKYSIQIAGLERTASAEEKAYNAQIDAQETAIRQMAANWEQYFQQLHGNIAAIPGWWVTALNAMGLSGAATAVAGDSNVGGNPGLALQNVHQQALSGAITTAQMRYLTMGRKLEIPGLASGGAVLKTGLAIVHEGETYSGVNGQVGGGQPITVIVSTRDEALAEFIDVRVEGANSQISRVQGVSADVRRRAGLV